MTKLQKITIAVISCLFVLVLILGSIFDLQISKLLADLNGGDYYSHNAFAIFFEVFAELIMFVLISIACTIIFYHFLRNPLKNKIINTICLAILPLLSFTSMVYGIVKTLDNLTPYVNYALDEFMSSIIGKVAYSFLAIGIVALIFLLLSKVKQETISKLFKWAIVVIVVCAISTLLVQVLKHIVARARYRAMVYEGYTDFDYYSPWFVINNNKFSSIFEKSSDYFKSFPSGHASAAASIFLLTLIPNYLNLGKKWKVSLLAISCAYVVLVMLSRIIAGAHFLTDVLIGSAITILLTYLANYLINKINLNDQNNKQLEK